ncbi:MAG: hypothetical protein IJI51_03540 [Lachnospiraceae bacterium]|nr:hypothetical protein [Lachnospiraceae bacterium]
MYITSLDHPEYKQDYNRCDSYHHPVVLHKNWHFHLGRFPSIKKLNEFMEFAGLKTGELTEEVRCGKAGMFRMWRVDGQLDDRGFNSVDELPEEAKPFTGLSNGRLVTCYLWNDGEILHIRRPDPNCEDVYQPLTTKEHIAHCRENGYV